MNWKEKKGIRMVRIFAQKMKYDRMDVYTAQASFYILMSAAPIIMLLFTLLKFTPLTQQTVMETLGSIIKGEIMDTVREIVDSVYHGSSVTISFAAVSLLWVAGKGILGMMNGLNNIHHLRENRNYIVRRLVASLYTVFMVMAFILAIGVLVFGLRFQAYIYSIFPWLLLLEQGMFYLEALIALCLLTLIFNALYVFLPNRRKRFISQLPGAVFATLSWCIFSYFFSIYLKMAKNMSLIYGGLVTLVVMMLWLYICMYLWFMGAELNAYLEDPEEFRRDAALEER